MDVATNIVNLDFHLSHLQAFSKIETITLLNK